MSLKTIQPIRNLFLLLLLSLFLLACTGCGSKSSATTAKPQAGLWKAKFSIKNSGQKDYNWVFAFNVSDDGKKASNIQAAHYRGELTPDTQATVLFCASTPSIDKNSFDFSFSELSGYTSHSYKGKTMFTSATKAEGTLDIDGAEYKWTAVPVSK